MATSTCSHPWKVGKKEGVGVKDAAGKDILSKVVKAGSEEVVQGVPPLKLHVGNAKGIQVVYNGQPIDYSAKTFNNTARVTLGAE